MKKFDFLDYRTVSLLILSRQFRLESQGMDTIFLVPYLDMCNHKLPEQSKWHIDSKKNCLVLEAQEAIPFGEQIYFSYGEKPTIDQFMMYGYFPEEEYYRRYDTRTIYLQMNDSDPLLIEKKKMVME